MAAPSITLGTPGNEDTGATSFTVALPAGTANKGVLIFVIENAPGDNLVLASTDWIEGGGIDVASVARRVAVFYRENTSDTSISITTGGFTCRAAWIPFTTDGDIAAAVYGASSSLVSTANPDPVALSSMASGDYRVAAVAVIADSRQTISAYPTNYADNQTESKAGANNGRPHLGFATRGLTAITAEDPGTFTISAAANALGWTFAIPAAAGGTITGTLAETQADQTVAATGIVGAVGTLAETQDPQTLAASGTVSGAVITGTLSETQDPQTLAASGTFTPAAVTGTLAETQAAQTLAASGSTARPLPAGLTVDEIGVVGYSNVGTYIDYYRLISGLDLLTATNHGGYDAQAWGDPLHADHDTAWGKVVTADTATPFRAMWIQLGFRDAWEGTFTSTDFEAWAAHVDSQITTLFPAVEYVRWSPMETYMTTNPGDGDAADMAALDFWGTNPGGHVTWLAGGDFHSEQSYLTALHAVAQAYADALGPWVNLTDELTTVDDRHPTEGTTPVTGQTHGGDILFEFFDGSAIVGTLAETQDAQTLAASGTFTPPPVTGLLAETQADQTLAASGNFIAENVVSGSLAETQDAQTSTASGTVTPPVFTGSLAETQDPQTVAAAGVTSPPTFTGALAETQDPQTVAAAGTFTPPLITGTLAETQDDQTLAATGGLPQVHWWTPDPVGYTPNPVAYTRL